VSEYKYVIPFRSNVSGIRSRQDLGGARSTHGREVINAYIFVEFSLSHKFQAPYVIRLEFCGYHQVVE
jgi:hypothetical protein